MPSDRYAPRPIEEDRPAHSRSLGLLRTDRQRPRPNPTLEQPDVTDLERETVKKLRNTGGWWEGDANALRVLRAYAAQLQAQQPKPKSPSLHA